MGFPRIKLIIASSFDVGYVLNHWVQPGDGDTGGLSRPPATVAGGFPDRREIVDRYAERTGFDLDGIDYYRAFAYWRSAAIAEGVKRRYLEGVMAGGDLDTDLYEHRVAELAAMSLDRARRLAGSAA